MFVPPFPKIEIVIVLGYVLTVVLFPSIRSVFPRKRKYASEKVDNAIARERQVLLQRMKGMFSYGIGPLFLIYALLPTNLQTYGIALKEPEQTANWTLVFACIIIPLLLLQARKSEHLSAYPQIRTTNWNASTIILSTITWIGYLLCYEFLFRGFLLFSCQRAFGSFIAIVINVLIYSCVHLPKGKFETLGAIPLGLVFCALTFVTQSIWFAFLAHVIMALANEWISLYHNKNLTIKI